MTKTQYNMASAVSTVNTTAGKAKSTAKISLIAA
jgi:hypothetical protein